MNYVKKVTSDSELIELANRLQIKLDAVLEIQEITKPLPERGTYIILLRRGAGLGHWVGVHDSNYFDSMAVGPPSVLGDLPYNKIQYQGTYSEYCGIFVMLWLYAKQHNRMDLLQGFGNLDVQVI